MHSAPLARVHNLVHCPLVLELYYELICNGLNGIICSLWLVISYMYCILSPGIPFMEVNLYNTDKPFNQCDKQNKNDVRVASVVQSCCSNLFRCVVM